MKVAIILGNRMNDDGSLSDLSKRRIELTKEMDKLINPDKIILSGGVANEKAVISEAYGMKEKLEKDGFDMSKIILEENSKTTKENAKFSVPMAEKLGATEIIVVSTLEHVGRSFLNPIPIFQKEMSKYRKIRLTFYTSD